MKLPMTTARASGDVPDLPFTGSGRVINSGEFSGLGTGECKEKIITWLEARGLGSAKVEYKLRDWIFSRQRYWGEPIPVGFGDDGSMHPLGASELPLTLPEVKSYQPSGDGNSPLATIDEWMSYPDPQTPGETLRRESNTMPQWAGSCWYYMRFIDPHNSTQFADKEKLAYWLPVDLYVGGAEHAVLHLLYARFWHRVLYKIGLVPCAEPFKRLVNQGIILGENGIKMSKSLGNVVNPDELIAQYGADSLRIYEMFMGPLQMPKPWNTNGLVGMFRFLNRVWNFAATAPLIDDSKTPAPLELQQTVHRAVKKVGEDIDRLAFNTAISQLMICLNAFTKTDGGGRFASLWERFVLLLSPFAPHIGEELWEQLGHTESLAYQAWPEYSQELIVDDTCTIAVQVNGKLRGTIECAGGLGREAVIGAAMGNEQVVRHLGGREPKKVIVVPDKLVNFVVAG